ncbi:hypothetical protein C1H46_012687 [Malus baccata]|uniref:Uncharacterized protein n=1 Tax=Malus baccata TaxID=106549 RepID=A0A540MU40_MALBA|nr:hypothetical protein C1H46_012687 [Malus baccata]
MDSDDDFELRAAEAALPVRKTKLKHLKKAIRVSEEPSVDESENGQEEEEKEEVTEEVGRAVIKVMNETEPPVKSGFLINLTLAFSGLNPNGHPSSCKPNYTKEFS